MQRLFVTIPQESRVRDAPSRLQNFPVAWFAVVMGLRGLTPAWNCAETGLPVPLAAVTLATLLACTHTGLAFFGTLARTLLAVATALTGVLAGRTAVAVARQEFCAEDG